MTWRRWLLVTCAVALLGTQPCNAAIDWSAPAEELTRKIAVISGPGAAAITFTNTSSLSAAEVNNFQRALIDRLRAAGVNATERPAAAALDIKVTAAENVQGYIFVAQVQQGRGDAKVAIISMARPLENAVVTRSTATVSLRKTLVLAQDAPMLDFALLSSGGAQHLLVLEPERVAMYGKQGTNWIMEQAVDVAHRHPFPRDVRGRIVLRQDRLFDAYLPGTLCSSSTSFPIALSCRDSDDPWPLAGDMERAFFSATRNFFTGALAPPLGDGPGRFYSAAMLPAQGLSQWLFSTTGGAAVIANGRLAALGADAAWGSDIAGIRTSCGGASVLASGAGDYSVPDSLRAFDLREGSTAAISDAIDFNGPTTALWTGADGNSVAVISRNLVSGKYEAYSVQASCLH